jgi:hypothetical protein
MLGYIDAIITRQDRYGIFRKFETMQIETASRRVLQELVQMFTTTQKEQTERIRATTESGENNKTLITTHE